MYDPVTPATPASPTDVATTAKKDATDLLHEARQDAKTEVDAAASALEKLLAHAAGDAKPLLTEAEQAAIPFVLSKVPGPFAGIVGGFVQAALGTSEAAVNTAVDSAVTKGLAIAQAEIASVAHHLEAAL